MFRFTNNIYQGVYGIIRILRDFGKKMFNYKYTDIYNTTSNNLNL